MTIKQHGLRKKAIFDKNRGLLTVFLKSELKETRPLTPLPEFQCNISALIFTFQGLVSPFYKFYMSEL